MTTGIICIDKPAGITSFTAVSRVRGMTGIKKIGHTGTLDPMATGVLPILLGRATRFLNYLPESDKGYRAGLRLGLTTDTLDITGTVQSEHRVTVSEEDVIRALAQFRGKISQLPPMYSAKSVDGRRLYELAREGIEIERTPCEVEIHTLEYLGQKDGEYFLDIRCSKGTYVRALIDDLGRALGCGAVMTSLQRTYASGFSLAECITLGELQARKDAGVGFEDVIRPLDSIFKEYPRVTVTAAQATRFQNGGALSLERIQNAPAPSCICTVYAPQGEFLGLGRAEEEELKAEKILPKEK